jgi:hypothetical protein
MKNKRFSLLLFIFVIPVLVAMIPYGGAMEGTSDGIFTNPQPTCPPAVCTGIDTNAITWGSETDPGTPVSSLAFWGQSFTTLTEQVFVIGEMNYYNGTIEGGTGIDSIDLCSEATITTPSSIIVTGCRQVDIINSPNTSDPFESADSVTMGTELDFFVFEEDSATATILAKLVPSSSNTREAGGELVLEIIGFGEVTSGGGFLRTSVYLPFVQRN